MDVVNQFTYWDLKYQLPSQYNIKADRALSSNSLTARIPLLDRDIVQWSLRIPSNLKLKNNDIEKYILRMAMKDFIPPEILNRRKLGFSTPVDFWLRTGLREATDELLDRLERRKEFFKQSFISRIKKYKYNKYFQNTVWNLIMFELWYETFFENDITNPKKNYF